MKKAVLKNFAIFAEKQPCWQKIKLMLSNTLSLNFYLKITHIFHPRYHPKIIGHILKGITENRETQDPSGTLAGPYKNWKTGTLAGPYKNWKTGTLLLLSLLFFIIITLFSVDFHITITI